VNVRKDSNIRQSAAKSKPIYIIYKITNKLNGKCYIGITSRRICDRWNEHVANSKGKRKRTSKFYNAIAKYGRDGFSREIIDHASTESRARELEIHYIDKFNSFERGYNSNIGGHGTLIFSEETKRKISESQKGKIIPMESRRKMSEAKLGDKRCSVNFGMHTQKGDQNPRAKTYLVEFPDGTQHIVCGLRAFCRDYGLISASLTRGHSAKGYRILERFDGYPEREYTQVSGNGEAPEIGA
jgi:group I intron endonuclease